MITEQELLAWEMNAPWPHPEQVEQDFLLSQCVAAIFKDKFLGDHVAMRGGTVLHKAHLAPAARYSEDIDLVLLTDRQESHIRKALIRVLKPVLGDPQESVTGWLKLAVRNIAGKSRIMRTTYAYDPTSSHLAGKSLLKVETNVSERNSCFATVPVDFTYPDANGVPKACTVRSFDIDEMLGTKMRALLQREQGRDLFDLYWAWHLSSRGKTPYSVTPHRVAEAFQFYMEAEDSAFSRAQYAEELHRRVTKTKFQHDVASMLSPAVADAYDIGQAYELVSDVFLAQLP